MDRGGLVVELYFVRHGQTDFSIGFDSGKTPNSSMADVPLNSVGREQAESCRLR